jgi:3-isopropylmalate dehydrogenase
MMLKYTFGQTQAADAIDAAISDVLDQGILTADLTDKKENAVNTEEMGTEIINALTNTNTRSSSF